MWHCFETEVCAACVICSPTTGRRHVNLKASLGTGLSTSGCSGCGEVFTSLTGFDRHQRRANGTLTCLPPAECGLELKPNGRWGFPGRTDGDD